MTNYDSEYNEKILRDLRSMQQKYIRNEPINIYDLEGHGLSGGCKCESSDSEGEAEYKKGEGKFHCEKATGAGFSGGKKRGRKPKSGGNQINKLLETVASEKARSYDLKEAGVGSGKKEDMVALFNKIMDSKHSPGDKETKLIAFFKKFPELNISESMIAGLMDRKNPHEVARALTDIVHSYKGGSNVSMVVMKEKPKRGRADAVVVKKIVDEEKNIEKKMEGGAKKQTPWMALLAKVRKEHPELKGVKAVIDYVKKNNLYKK